MIRYFFLDQWWVFEPDEFIILVFTIFLLAVIVKTILTIKK